MKRCRQYRIAPHSCSGCLALLLMLAVGPVVAVSPQDLTGLSLEELMAVELPASAPSSRFQVSATAVDSCIVAATDLSFGRYNPLNLSPTDASSMVTVTCTVNSGFVIGLDAGIGNGATTNARRMSNGDSLIDYSLYRDSAHNLVWGNDEGTNTASGIGTGAPAEYPVYGRIPPRQTVQRGVYTDTVTVWVSF